MIREALNAYAARAGRAFSRDRQATVGASEVGKCARLVYFLKNEHDGAYHHDRDPKHVDGWGARERGNLYEAHAWVPAMRARYGSDLLFAGDEQRTLVDGFLSATPDGLLINQPKDTLNHLGVAETASDIVVECKSLDPRATLDGAKPEHVYQVQAQIGLVRALTNFRPTHGVISYTDASFHDEIREFVIAFDETVYAEAKRRARDVMLATKPDYLKPEGVIAGSKECKLCPFTAACGQIRADRVPAQEIDIDPATIETIKGLAMLIRLEEGRVKKAEQQAAELKEELKATLSAAGTKALDRDGLSIRWSPLKGRPSYDNKAIREAAVAAGIDIEKFSRVGDATDRLAIKILAQSGEVSAAAAAS